MAYIEPSEVTLLTESSSSSHPYNSPTDFWAMDYDTCDTDEEAYLTSDLKTLNVQQSNKTNDDDPYQVNDLLLSDDEHLTPVEELLLSDNEQLIDIPQPEEEFKR